jgi:hypothetical protein
MSRLRIGSGSLKLGGRIRFVRARLDNWGDDTSETLNSGVPATHLYSKSIDTNNNQGFWKNIKIN